jgi:hypothetical protein
MARLLRIARRVLGALLAIAFVLLLPAVWIGWHCGAFGGGDVGSEEAVGDSGQYARPEDQTYLTLPEWYIVYSADEYAASLATNPPSAFPYAQAIRQYWVSYRDVCAVTRKRRYPFNTGYHLSLYVIGTSFSAEYLIKGFYENTMGRLTEWISSGEPTAEEAYARSVAVDFGQFIHTIPWYEYPYAEKLGGLWSSTPLWSANPIRPIRQWERKAVLSAEYGGKAVYAWLIKLGTQGAYAPEDLKIRAVVENLPQDDTNAFPDVSRVSQIDDRTSVVAITRYEAFTDSVQDLVKGDVKFVEIAGNDDILVTVLAPVDWVYDLSVGDPLFEMPILTQPQLKRVAIDVPVHGLHLLLGDLESRPVALEHIYDY